MGRIIGIIVFVLLVVGCVWWWRNYHTGNQYDGAVVRRDAAMETGTTTMENGQNLGEEAHPTPSRSDAPGTINGEPVANRSDLDTQTTPITTDPYASTAPNAPRPLNSSHAPQVSYSGATPPYAAPPTDTQSPEAPDGLRFGGSGIYQWYRQGDITYRLDTRTGSSCIIYATLEEWRKPYVYRHGCRAF